MSFVLASEVLGGHVESGVVYVLHGALGSGQNFRGFVRQLLKRCPDRQYVLVDLRNHGGSTPAPPPQTLAACAVDIVRLSEHLASLGVPQPNALIGHSFGGKVALEAASLLGFGASEQVVLLDSNPGSQEPEPDHEVLQVIRAVRAVPMPATTRAEVVDFLRAGGMNPGLANWMTTNLKREADRYRWVFDLDAIELLITDYFAVDLWPRLEDQGDGPEVHLVVAEHSDRFNPALRERALRVSSEQSRVSLHSIANAGHWLHVDNPAALLELLAALLGKGA